MTNWQRSTSHHAPNIGAHLGGMGANLGGMGAHLGGMGAHLGGIGAHLGGIGAHLGGIGAHLGGIGAYLGGRGGHLTEGVRGLLAGRHGWGEEAPKDRAVEVKMEVLRNLHSVLRIVQRQGTEEWFHLEGNREDSFQTFFDVCVSNHRTVAGECAHQITGLWQVSVRIKSQDCGR